MRNVRRLVVSIAAVALSFAAVTGAGVRIRGGSMGDTEKEILLTALIAGGVMVLLSWCLTVGKWGAVLGVPGALATVATGGWAVALVWRHELAWGHKPADPLFTNLLAAAVAAATLAQICLMIGYAGRLKLLAALTVPLILTVAGFAYYFLFGPSDLPGWFNRAWIAVGALDGLGTLVSVALVRWGARKSAAESAAEPTFSTPLRNRYGRPAGSETPGRSKGHEPLPALADEDDDDFTMWDEVVRQREVPDAPAMSEPELATATWPRHGVAAESSPVLWTERWDDDATEVIPKMGPDEVFDPAPATEPEATPAEPPTSDDEPSAPRLPGPAVLLSSDVEWRLIQTARKFGLTPDDIVEAAISGMNELDDEP